MRTLNEQQKIKGIGSVYPYLKCTLSWNERVIISDIERIANSWGIYVSNFEIEELTSCIHFDVFNCNLNFIEYLSNIFPRNLIVVEDSWLEKQIKVYKCGRVASKNVDYYFDVQIADSFNTTDHFDIKYSIKDDKHAFICTSTMQNVSKVSLDNILDVATNILEVIA